MRFAITATQCKLYAHTFHASDIQVLRRCHPRMFSQWCVAKTAVTGTSPTSIQRFILTADAVPWLEKFIQIRSFIALMENEKMTNAEAIETLRANYPDACFEQLREAVDKAIKALEAHQSLIFIRRLAENGSRSHQSQLQLLILRL